MNYIEGEQPGPLVWGLGGKGQSFAIWGDRESCLQIRVRGKALEGNRLESCWINSELPDFCCGTKCMLKIDWLNSMYLELLRSRVSG